MNDNFIDKTVKKSPHLLYAVMLLFVGLAFVASWTYIKHQEIEIKRQKQEQEIELKKQQQQSLDEAAAKKEIEEQNRDTLRFECVAAAERDYYKYLALNGKKMKNKDGSTYYRLPQHAADFASKKLKEANELCLKEYPVSK